MPSFSTNTRFAMTALATAISAVTSSAHAASLVVTSLAPVGPGSLVEAITSANASDGVPDTITFDVKGTIFLGSNEVPGITDDLTIEGPGAGYLTIDGGGVSSEGTVFRAGLCQSDNVTLRDLTITNSPLGAIYADCGVNLTVDNVTLTANTGGSSPVLNIIEGAVLTMMDSKFTDNSGSSEGGLIYLSGSGGHSISDSQFTDNDNTSGTGGVLYLNSVTSATIDNCDFKRNTAAFGGGAIGLAYSAATTISNSTFVDNEATASDGGAIINFGSELTVENSTFVDNSASAGRGGAIHTIGSGYLFASGSQFTSNTSKQDGGAVYIDGGGLDIATSSFVSNQADPDLLGLFDGGAIKAVSSSEGSITDSRFAGNSVSGDGGGVYVATSASFVLDRVTVTGNSAKQLGGGVFASMSNDLLIQRSVISDNVSGSDGASMFLRDASGQISAITVSQTTVSGNSVDNEGTAFAADLDTDGSSLTISQSTFSDNTGGSSAAIRFGDDFSDTLLGTVAITNSTFSGNTGNSPDQDWAILFGAHAAFDVSYSTFVDNVSGATSGGVQVFAADRPNDTTAANAAFSFSHAAMTSAESSELRVGRAGGVGFGSTPSLQYVTAENGVNDNASSTTSQINVADPQLAVLQDNGGYTLTHAPASAASPVIDTEVSATRPDGDVDQRGVATVAASDNGAVEYTDNRGPQLIGNLATELKGVRNVSIGTVNLLALLSDPEGDTITINAIEGLPPGLVGNTGAGTVTGTPTVGGTFSVVVEASDDGVPSVTSVFKADVVIADRAARKGSGGGSAGMIVLGLLGLLGLRRRNR